MHDVRRRPPALQPTEREIGAIACLAPNGSLHWVRIFESSIKRRTPMVISVTELGRRYETPDGSPVHFIRDGLYLTHCRRTHEWIELETLDSKSR